MSQDLTIIENKELVAEQEARVKVLMREAKAYLEPIGISTEFFGQVLLTAMLNSGHLRGANRDSFNAAVLKCAQRGMLPDGESAVLVTFKENVTLIPMVGGMTDMIRRNCPGIGIECRVVRIWDKFRVQHGTSPILDHIPEDMPEGRDIKDLNRIETMKGAYAIITMPPLVRGANPVREQHYMTRAEIERVRSGVYGSRTPKSAWTNHPARMYEKTVLKAAMRRLPSRHQIFAHFDPNDLEDYSKPVRKAEIVPVAAIPPPKVTKI